MAPTTLGRDPHPSLTGFREPARAWFTSSFEAPIRAQELGWPVIQSGASALVLAPTGSGKTLAAFLAAIDRLMFDDVPALDARCRVLYISPLKALAVDIDRNLRAPLVGISRFAERMEIEFHAPEVAVRTGDTPSSERDDVLVRFHADHRNDRAVFTFGIVRGSNGLANASTPPSGSTPNYVEVASATAPLSPAPGYALSAGFYERTFEPDELVGACVNAAFAASLSVYGKATNGWWRLGYDAYRLIAFALAARAEEEAGPGDGGGPDA